MRALFCLLVVLLASPAYADDCLLFQPFDEYKIWSSTDERLLSNVREVRELQGVTEPYLVCEWDVYGAELLGPTVKINGVLMAENTSAVHIVFMAHAFLVTLTDSELRGLIAHEFAHVSRGVHVWRRDESAATAALKTRYEMEADLHAAASAGVDDVLAGVRRICEHTKAHWRTMTNDKHYPATTALQNLRATERHCDKRFEALIKLQQDQM